VVVGCDLDSSRRACDVVRGLLHAWRLEYETEAGRATAMPGIRIAAATIGIHPSEVCYGSVTADTIDMKMDELRALYEAERDVIVAIGECGIDMHYDGAAAVVELQQEVFARQCAWAQDIGLPLVVHSRDGFSETVEVMKKYPDVVYYVHCFGYGVQEVKKFLEGFAHVYFGCDGNISYPKAQGLRDACRVIPDDSLILETDAPYLAPQ
jgi:TatD DNase family protein